MKKFIAMLLALVMVLSLVACGDKKDDAAGTDDSDKDSQDTITLKMHFVDPETAPFVQGGKKIAELVSEATDGRIQIEVPSAASATRSSSRWTTAWISPPARTPC